jgi:hypothetical protein
VKPILSIINFIYAESKKKNPRRRLILRKDVFYRQRTLFGFSFASAKTHPTFPKEKENT